MECSVRDGEEGVWSGGRGGVSYKVSSYTFYNPIYTMLCLDYRRADM